MEDKKKEKKEWTVKRILTTVIIGILALLMVGGTFFYIFSPGFSKKSQAFGFYDGEPILYENNNVFSRTLMADENYANAATTFDMNTMYNSWYNAYHAQVVYVAFSKMAKDAGIIAPQELVDKTAVNSGAFNNEEGVFDKAVYDSISEADKRYFMSYIQSIYPYQVVINDIYTSLTSSKEVAFVADYAANARTFDYFVLGANACPDYIARDYARANFDLFKIVDLSMISCGSEEEAKECHSELVGGLSWADAVAKYSHDGYASNEGRIGGEIFADLYVSNMVNPEDLAKILALDVDGFTDPIEGTYAWTIYKNNAEIKDPDLYDETVTANIKQAIYNDHPEMIQNYIDESLEVASNMAQHDFDMAAEFYSFGKVTVGPVSNNIGGSSLMYGIDAFDSEGVLAAAIADEELNKTLYSEGVGHIVGPIEVNGGYLFARVTGESVEEDLRQLTEAMYSYYQTEMGIVDFENSIILSSKHDDNFVSKFLEVVFGNTAE